MDTVTPERRSEIMRRIRGSNTAPEMAVRKFLHASGLRFRLHRGALPGRPDIVFPSRRVCVFVHGCFWHGCPTCVDGTRRVKSNSIYWTGKVATNRARDERNERSLLELGWFVLTIWECETVREDRLAALERAVRSQPISLPTRTSKPSERSVSARSRLHSNQ